MTSTSTASGVAELPAKSGVVARAADFPELNAKPGGAGIGSLSHLLNVTVVVSAELGRATCPIGDVLKYGLGAVVPLDRAVAEPVDLFVQGVRVGRGEVVVVDNHFAIRITEIAESKKS